MVRFPPIDARSRYLRAGAPTARRYPTFRESARPGRCGRPRPACPRPDRRGRRPWTADRLTAPCLLIGVRLFRHRDSSRGLRTCPRSPFRRHGWNGDADDQRTSDCKGGNTHAVSPPIGSKLLQSRKCQAPRPLTLILIENTNSKRARTPTPFPVARRHRVGGRPSRTRVALNSSSRRDQRVNPPKW